jgi:hypothetical protein
LDARGEALPIHRCPRTGAFQVEAVGTGMMMVKREVFTRLAAAYPELRVPVPKADLPPEAAPFLSTFFLPMMSRWGALLPEDYAFCHRWRAIGGKIWCDPAIRVRHHGSFAYEADPMALFVPAEGTAAA